MAEPGPLHPAAEDCPVPHVFTAMDNVRALVLLSVCLSASTGRCQGQRSPDNQPPPAGARPETLGDLADTLQALWDDAVLGAGQGAELLVQKKASVIPRCEVGERCAMKHGPRIGRLCDCLRGTACNTFFLRCY